MTVAIVTDSIACLTPEHIQQYNIKVVPVNIFFNGKVYRDWVDLTPSQAYEFLEKAPEFWKSSAPAPEDYWEAYQEISKHAQNILVVTISSKLSMCYNSAVTAKERAKEELPKAIIEVLDSETCTAAEGFIALAAARAAAKGKTFDEVIAIAKQVKEKVKFVALLETIRYAYRTGRIPKIASQIGSILSIKPILTAKDGLIHFVTATRTKDKGIEKMLHIMREYQSTSKSLHVAIMHAAALEEAEKLKERVAAEFNCAELFIADFSPVMGYATGWGTLALAFYSLD